MSIAKTEEEALLLELFADMSDEDQAAMLKVALWLVDRPKDEPLTLEMVQEMFESAKRIH